MLSFPSQLTAKSVKSDQMYRSTNIIAQIKRASKVMLVIYDAAGYVAEALTYQGNGDFKSWFAQNNLISNLNWVFGTTYNFYSYEGDARIGRRFYIQEAYGGCNNDPGYLLIACNRPDGSSPCVGYESMGNNQGAAKQYLCKILYTNSNGVQKTKKHAIASAIEIFVK